MREPAHAEGRTDSAPNGTRVTVTAANVPAGIGKAEHDAGLRSSLDNLARHLGPG